jgi:hypothetical protein
MDDATDNYVKTLQDELERRNKDYEALKSELTGDDPDNTPATVIKSSLLENVPEYVKNIDALAQASDSESVKLAANKLLIEWAVTDRLVTGADATDEEFRTLLKQLAKQKG